MEKKQEKDLHKYRYAKTCNCEQCNKRISEEEYDCYGGVCADCATENLHDD